MRIIAGTHRGRTILGPEDDTTTRPVTDRVKEALFSRLMSLGLLGYGTVADVFSGTGSMGLEALSRGAERCVFIERDRAALQRLNENLSSLGLSDRAEVRTGDALSTLWVRSLPDEALTVAWVDPPYALLVEPAPAPEEVADAEAERPVKGKHKDKDKPARPLRREAFRGSRLKPNPDAVFALIAALLPKLEPGGAVVLRTPEPCPTPPPELPGLDGPVSIQYGSMTLHFYQRPMPSETDEV